MNHSETYLAHHFDDIHQQREAMTLGMWVFLITEIMFFSGLFAAYAVYRSWYPLAFAEGGHHMHFWLGTINTGVLLISSYCVALSVHAAQSNHQRMLRVCLAVTILLGLAFLGIKAYEYYSSYADHHLPGPGFELKSPHFSGVEPRHVEIFYSLYFAMTGVHAAHMVIGVGVFSTILAMALRGKFSSQHFMPVEVAGLYWHFVDIVWVFLYPLLYLVA